MPWNECQPMDERLRFIARLLEGEKMAPLCREFGISRVTGYKIFNRYTASPISSRLRRVASYVRVSATNWAFVRPAVYERALLANPIMSEM
jgi:hypothetical protein